MFVNHNRVIKVVVVEAVLESIVLDRRCLRLGRLLSLRGPDCIVFELLQNNIVQVVEIVVRELIHGRRSLRPMSGMTMPLEATPSVYIRSLRRELEGKAGCVRLSCPHCLDRVRDLTRCKRWALAALR